MLKIEVPRYQTIRLRLRPLDFCSHLFSRLCLSEKIFAIEVCSNIRKIGKNTKTQYCSLSVEKKHSICNLRRNSSFSNNCIGIYISVLHILRSPK